MLVALLLVVCAPGEGHVLKYRFEKGMVYEDRTLRSTKFERNDAGRRLVFDVESEEVLRRTILETDRTDHPTIERVEVLTFTRTTNDHPEEEAGTVKLPSQGNTFVWRRMEKRWRLFDKAGEVTGRHPVLVERLKNWRDARLPKKAVKVGDTWEISAKAFLETVGARVPADVEGRGVFRLEGVEGAVATIKFEYHYAWRTGGELVSAGQTGTWRFDLEKGRDLSLESEGKVKFDNGRSGSGTFRTIRTVTYRP